MHLELTAEAEAELLAAVDWYETRRQGLGKQFAMEVRRVMNRIADAPLASAMRDDGYRRANCAVFPYFVPYIVRDERIIILAVAHGHRRPGYWQDRLD